MDAATRRSKACHPLAFEIRSKLDIDECLLALEMRRYQIVLNGKTLENKVVGYYVDEAIQTVKMPKIQKA